MVIVATAVVFRVLIKMGDLIVQRCKKYKIMNIHIECHLENMEV